SSYNATSTTDTYPLSLHDALPIYPRLAHSVERRGDPPGQGEQKHGQPECLPAGEGAEDLELRLEALAGDPDAPVRWESEQKMDRSEEHTSELQSRSDLVCRLLLEK